MSSVHLFSLMKWWHYIYTIIRLNKVTCQNLLKKARGTKSSPPVSKTSADTLKTDSKLQKIHKLFVNITSQVKILQEFTSMQVTMMQNSQKNSKCVYEPAKAEHSLNCTTWPFVCDTMESVSGIIAYYLVVRDWCIIQRSGQHAVRLWSVKATAHCEVCDNLSRNASFYNTTAALETDKAQHLLQLIKNMQRKKTWYILLYNHNNQAYLQVTLALI